MGVVLVINTKWLLLVVKTSKSIETECGNFGGLAKANNLSRQICIVLSSGTLVKSELTLIKIAHIVAIKVVCLGPFCRRSP